MNLITKISNKLALATICLLLAISLQAQALVKHPGFSTDKYEVVGAPAGTDFVWKQSLDGRTFVWDTSAPVKTMRKGGMISVECWEVRYDRVVNRARRIRLLFTLNYNNGTNN